LCVECSEEEWFHVFDFSLGQQGWTTNTFGDPCNGPSAVYVPGSGWAQTAADPCDQIQIKSPTFTGTITHVQVFHSIPWSSGNPRTLLRRQSDSSTLGEDTTGNTEVDITVSSGIITDDELHLDRDGDVGNQTSTPGILTMAIVYGVGEDPFI
jgi:hypothetical protein